MKVLFIVPSTGYYSRALSNPLGVLSIATYLKNNGYDVKVHDRNVKKANIHKLIDSFNPDVVGVSVMSSRCLKDALAVSKAVKNYGGMVVWGGQLPTMNTDICFQCDAIDYIVMGEGEITWLEFIRKIEIDDLPDSIDGIAYKKYGKIVVTKCREFADLKDLPNIDWSLVNPAHYYQKYIHSDKMLWLYSSKGCPCNCSFCGNREYHKCIRRKRPVDMVIEEIENLIADYNMDAVYFTDELWCINKDEGCEFCQKVKDCGLNFIWGVQARIGQFSRDNFQTLYDSNCRWILFGVESGSRSMMERIHKGISIDDVEETVKNCIEVGITPITAFIIGFPGETEEELQETVNLIMRIKSKLITVYHFFPTPGSDIQKELVEMGLYKEPKNLNECMKTIATETLRNNFSNIPSKDLRVIRCFFHWLGFIGKDSINQGGAFAFGRQAISDMFSVITKKGMLYFLVGAYTAAKEFLYVFWHVVAYPRVRKKYGLYTKNKQ
jgi:anaerobic magnesium-protoporphyrin IX monomethyl ester cyclase